MDFLYLQNRFIDMIRDNDLVTMSISFSKGLAELDKHNESQQLNINPSSTFPELALDEVLESSSSKIEVKVSKRSRRKRGGSSTQTTQMTATKELSNLVSSFSAVPISPTDVQSLWEYFRNNQQSDSHECRGRRVGRSASGTFPNKRQRVDPINKQKVCEAGVATSEQDEGDSVEQQELQQSGWRQITAHDQLQVRFFFSKLICVDRICRLATGFLSYRR